VPGDTEGGYAGDTEVVKVATASADQREVQLVAISTRLADWFASR